MLIGLICGTGGKKYVLETRFFEVNLHAITTTNNVNEIF